MKRLKLVAEVIGAPVPSAEALKRLASAIKGFSEELIDRACYQFEGAPQGEYKRLPTPAELTKACQEAAARTTQVAQTRWCGRCELGHIRGSDREIHRCECNCEMCDNSGFVAEMQAVAGMPYKRAVFAKRCPKGCRVASGAAA